MRTTFMILTLTAAVSGVCAATEIRSFGEPLCDYLEVTPIETILSDPDAWAGREVRIAGRVSGVCTRKGCWMDLASAEDATLRVKVDDDVIVFPQDAEGCEAVAEGEVEILDMDRDGYEAWLRHVAQETGGEFDPASVGEPPYRVVRLRGRGVEVHGP